MNKEEILKRAEADKYVGEQECNIAYKPSIRQKLERQKETYIYQIKRAEAELEKVEAGIKLLDKNKELETLANLFNL